ncbi:MAG: hypothetical protein M1515_04505 [Candidatus Thermoplasmatota archaeon]|jgi:hypothetical protein|nr:hypothetical protein [Candidatus Thermoplasmatota archaeon]
MGPTVEENECTGKRRRKMMVILATVLMIVIVTLYSLNFGIFTINREEPPQLQLIAGESSALIDSGNNITLQVEIFNNGPTVEVNRSALWPTIGGLNRPLAMSPCGENLPFGFIVLDGFVNYSSYNSGSPLEVWYPGIYFCPAIYAVSFYTILGHSDNAILGGIGNPVNITLRASVNLSGYWVQSSFTNDSYNFVNFPSG